MVHYRNNYKYCFPHYSCDEKHASELCVYTCWGSLLFSGNLVIYSAYWEPYIWNIMLVFREGCFNFSKDALIIILFWPDSLTHFSPVSHFYTPWKAATQSLRILILEINNIWKIEDLGKYISRSALSFFVIFVHVKMSKSFFTIQLAFLNQLFTVSKKSF